MARTTIPRPKGTPTAEVIRARVTLVPGCALHEVVVFDSAHALAVIGVAGGRMLFHASIETVAGASEVFLSPEGVTRHSALGRGDRLEEAAALISTLSPVRRLLDRRTARGHAEATRAAYRERLRRWRAFQDVPVGGRIEVREHALLAGEWMIVEIGAQPVRTEPKTPSVMNVRDWWAALDWTPVVAGVDAPSALGDRLGAGLA